MYQSVKIILTYILFHSDIYHLLTNRKYWKCIMQINFGICELKPKAVVGAEVLRAQELPGRPLPGCRPRKEHPPGTTRSRTPRICKFFEHALWSEPDAADTFLCHGRLQRWHGPGSGQCIFRRSPQQKRGNRPDDRYMGGVLVQRVSWQ